MHIASRDTGSPRSGRHPVAHGEAVGQRANSQSQPRRGNVRALHQTKTYLGSYSTPCFFKKASTSSRKLIRR